MKNLKILALINALATGIYVALILFVLFNIEKKMPDFLGPVVFLLSFVLSASVTGSLVLGKPILMYLENRKTEAIKLFLYTIAWLFLVTTIVIIVGILV